MVVFQRVSSYEQVCVYLFDIQGCPQFALLALDQVVQGSIPGRIFLESFYAFHRLGFLSTALE